MNYNRRKNSITLGFIGILILQIGFAILSLFLIIYLVKEARTMINTETNKYIEHVGEEYVLNSDTLIITDYSLLEESFTLSNGVKINYHLVAK